MTVKEVSIILEITPGKIYRKISNNKLDPKYYTKNTNNHYVIDAQYVFTELKKVNQNNQIGISTTLQKQNEKLKTENKKLKSKISKIKTLIS